MSLFSKGRRTAADPTQEVAEISYQQRRRGFGRFWVGRLGVNDPAATLRVRAEADPESDTAEELLIESEREGIERSE